MQIRQPVPEDHQRIVKVVKEWWGGRDLSSGVLKIFFYHFRETCFIAEDNGNLAGFLLGFLSQTYSDEGYIQLAGVHPEFREIGVGRSLYAEFFDVCRANSRSIVRSCTSPVNTLSIAFHASMGFSIEDGDDIVAEIPVTHNYLSEGQPKVLFMRKL